MVRHLNLKFIFCYITKSLKFNKVEKREAGLTTSSDLNENHETRNEYQTENQNENQTEIQAENQSENQSENQNETKLKVKLKLVKSNFLK